TPPFDQSRPHPGYIMGYPPGVRENGGQYTHASVWVAMAYARMGAGARAVEVLQMLNPVEHARTPNDYAIYRTEPYAVAADVYSIQSQSGRGGWTWYTGSSGWMYRVWLEEVLGFRLRGEQLHLDPVIASDWSGFQLRYRHRNTLYEIAVENPDHAVRGIAWIELDGERLPEPVIPLVDDGRVHAVVARLGAKVSAGPEG